MLLSYEIGTLVKWHRWLLSINECDVIFSVHTINPRFYQRTEQFISYSQFHMPMNCLFWFCVHIHLSHWPNKYKGLVTHFYVTSAVYTVEMNTFISVLILIDWPISISFPVELNSHIFRFSHCYTHKHTMISSMIWIHLISELRFHCKYTHKMLLTLCRNKHWTNFVHANDLHYTRVQCALFDICGATEKNPIRLFPLFTSRNVVYVLFLAYMVIGWGSHSQMQWADWMQCEWKRSNATRMKEHKERDNKKTQAKKNTQASDVLFFQR